MPGNDSGTTVVAQNPAELTPVGIGDRFVRHRRIIIATGFGFVIIAGMAAVAIAFSTVTVERLVAHTVEVRTIAKDLRSSLLDAETGQRGYVLTGEPNYLTPYEEAVTDVPALIGRLSTLTADNAAQQKRLSELERLTVAKFDELRRTVELMRQGQRDTAIVIVRSDTGQEMMENIRAELDAFVGEETGLLTARQAEAEGLRTWLLILIGVSFLAAITLAGLFARSTQHFIERLRERTAELELEARRRGEAENTLRQSQKMEAVGQLTGGIAHDFNNLLTIIIGNLDTLGRRLAKAEPTQTVTELAATLTKPLESAKHASKSAAQLTHRLLAFARQQTLEVTPLDLNRLVSGMSDMLRRTLGETVSVETVLAGGLWQTMADANQLENVLINLAVNARDAMPDGGHLTIETANAYLDDAYVMRFGDVAAGQYVLMSVTDTGAGMSSDLLERVFEPFFTTKGAGEGSGLGLAMVHGFVKQSGGHVRLYSEVGEGTTVKIYLPRLMAAEQAGAPAMKPISDATLARAQPQETILLVEDNAGVREYVRSALEELGYTVLEAADARKALRIFDAAPRIDLLFTDVVLPGGMTGRELANKILERRADLPVLYTTGYTRNAIVHHGRLDPNVHLLGKPYTQQALARKVREVLDGKRRS